MFKLKCAFQTYDWGKVGENSTVFQLLKGSSLELELDDTKPYAELWFGTHPSGPSLLSDCPCMSLNNYISKFPTCLGAISEENFGRSLPFLLKVLSIEKALSIQAHPTKEHAQLLHAQRPDLYKDANHKPELAITLTPFEALLGFRSLKHIASFVQSVPELLEIVGNDCLSDLISVSQLVEDEDSAGIAIKAAYQKLMRTDEEKVASLVNQLRDRLLQGEQLQFSVPDHINLSELADVFIRLSTQFPGDVGCFSLFFLNYIKLETGQAVFLEANLPHAYLSGDCVECMACSDNVVRAGLTPKYKDVDCLLNMLQYEPRTAEDLIFPGESRPVELPAVGPWLSDAEITSRLPTPQVIRFAPPVEDFAVDKLLIPPSCRAFELLPLPCASILVFITGSGFLQQIPPKLPDSTADKQSSSSNTNSSGFPVNAQPAGRVHQVLEFTRGTVVFISAGISCCIWQVPKDQAPNASPDACLAFRAFINIDQFQPDQ